MHAFLEVGQRLDRDGLLRQLVDMLYTRNDHDFHRGTFRVRGDVVEVIPAVRERARAAHRVLRRRDRVDRRDRPAARQGPGAAEARDDLPGQPLRRDRGAHPGRPAPASAASWPSASPSCAARGKLLEAQRLEQRTMYDLEMLEEMGFCHGVENYSRWLDGREAGQPPYTLYDYFPKDGLVLPRREPRDRAADRRHVPRRPRAQGDAGRVRLPAAVGARQPAAALRGVGERARTPASTCRPRPATTSSSSARAWWWSRSSGPTGLVDPQVEVRPAAGQVDDLLGEIRARVAARGARAGHDAHQAHGRGADRVLRRPRRARALPAQRHPDHRAHRDHPRAARGRLRRAGRHQPAARGARHPRGRAGRDPRRRQGRLPALDALADPDHRARRAQRERHGDPVRRQGDRLDPQRRSRRPTAAASSRLRYNAEHGITPADREEAHLEPARLDLGGGLRDGAEARGAGASRTCRRTSCPA